MGPRSRCFLPLLGLLAASCTSDSSYGRWRAPLLLGIRDLTTIVSLQATVSFGDERRAVLPPVGAYHGYLIDGTAGAVLSVGLTAAAESEPALAFYGPRSPEGIFGRPIAARADARPVSLRIDLPARGVYLILVGAARRGGADYSLRIECEGGCAPTACRATLCSLFCPAGFRRDASGCETCECKPGGELLPTCVEGTACGPGRVCRGGSCQRACSCNEPYAPVCGADGLTYASRCELACKGVDLAAEGACRCGDGPPCGADERCEDGACVKVPDCSSCPDTFAPVCGHDGLTYGNRCLLDCAGIALRGEGACLASSGGCAASCLDDKDCGATGVACVNGYCQPQGCEPNRPVCGSDGVTYPSSCEIPWCRGVTVSAPSACCSCPTVYAPVCGADGRTYANRCEAACVGANAVAEGACAGSCLGAVCELSCAYGLRKDASGCETCACQEGPSCGADADCTSPRQSCVQGVCKEACICPIYWDPVCGTDMVTYANACEAFCAGAAISQTGSCTSRSFAETNVCADACSFRSTEPVCGADGNTYEGGCALCSAGVQKAYDGPCQPETCDCPDKFDPMCGSDGVTYGNACLAGCQGIPIASEGACPSAGSSCPAFANCTLACANGYQTDPDTGCRLCACR